MYYELQPLTKSARRKLRKMNGGVGLRCHFEMLNGNRCQQGALVVRVKRRATDPQPLKMMRTKYCRAHSDPALLERLGASRFGGKVSTSGDNRGARAARGVNPHKAMREMVEEHLVEFLKPYMEALTATKEVVVGHGRHARVEVVPDHRARMQAAESLFDRVYGKPKQSTVLEGGITVEPVEVPTDQQRELEVAKILAAAGAVAPMAGAESAIKKASKASQN
jgi:hypothetical protein